MTDEILLIPDKIDIERDSVAEIWKNNGGEIKRIGKFWEQPDIDLTKRITIYGIDTFSLVLAQIVGVKLVEPKDEMIGQLDFDWIKRKIDILRIYDVNESLFPAFIKPVKPKTFKSKVYDDFTSFLKEVNGIDQAEKIIKSSIISIESEVRAFILNEEILDMAIYEGNSDLISARKFLNDFLKIYSIDLPKTYVVDLGYNKVDGWFIIEFNSSWGAGLNLCDPSKIIDAIREATIN
ncbi:ATP-grasp domain-containing protein [Flavobacterium jejuense]|uniref:ATP-grasp domain-containing protein n=1 Tax=Flavobacterium jejuense TaxID=1544455 RepID=A0ABX0ILT9_9FLAO|nr:ATP-grasp domain-containing protein [Flavobacterium jejuense]NHN24683.1 ATP-grasp domain-containing protein [Flavobacterium jejuense]